MLIGTSRERVFECHGEVLADADGRPTRVLGTARDITVHHRAQQELAYLAEHDPLTGMRQPPPDHRAAGRVRREPRAAPPCC